MLILALALVSSDPLAQPFATLAHSDAELAQCKTESTPRCGFLVVDANWPAYAAIEIASDKPASSGRASMAYVKDKLVAKQNGLDHLVTAYRAIAQGDDEWAVAASCRVAETLLEYARALRAAKDPPALAGNPEGLDLFRSELENRAFPVEAQAIEQLQKTVQLAEEKHIDSPYVHRCKAQLATRK
jgi:hypothetical protein